ncbi:MAG: BBP7 family outer membrane beta-barrel protein [Planctomycetia bacterium]|nr:BBP7 family outer membrane beta-barrel protein [Planctomycetia bacterium]
MKRLTACLLTVGLAVACATRASAEWEPTDFQLMFDDARPFSLYDASSFDRKPYAPEGFYVVYEHKVMLLQAGPVAVVGDTNRVPRFVFDGIEPTLEYNNASTGAFEAKDHKGDQVTVGYMDGNCGWEISGFKLHGHESVVELSDVHMIWADPLQLLQLRFIDADGDGFDDDLDGDLIFGRDGRDTDVPPNFIPDQAAPVDFDDTVADPIIFDILRLRSELGLWGLETNRVYRFDRLHYGGWLECLIGFRYFNFNEKFGIDSISERESTSGADDVLPVTRAILSETRIDTDADNNLFTGQIGFRWWKKVHRFTCTLDGRAGVGFNWQAIHQTYSLASDQLGRNTGLIPTYTGSGGNNDFHSTELTGFVDAKYTLAYQLTSNFSVRVGGTALYIDGLARPTNMVNYSLPNVGILGDSNRDHLIAWGYLFGFDFNR